MGISALLETTVQGAATNQLSAQLEHMPNIKEQLLF